jgi:hypothetical protein
LGLVVSLGDRITGWILTIVGANVAAGGILAVVIGLVMFVPGPGDTPPPLTFKHPLVVGGVAVGLGALAWWGGRRLRRRPAKKSEDAR